MSLYQKEFVDVQKFPGFQGQHLEALRLIMEMESAEERAQAVNWPPLSSW